MENPIANHWYEKKWLVVLLCVLLFPLGLYGLWKNSSISISWKIGGTVIVSLLVLLAISDKNEKSNENLKSEENTSSTIELNASVEFTGTQFIITNKDTFDYKDAKLQLNEDFIIKGKKLEAGKSYTVGMLQFADKKGNRFDMTKKPLNFSIWCDLENKKNGFYYAEWK